MSGRSYTDPVTGRVSLRQFALEARLRELFQKSLPLADLLEIFHERAHHTMAVTHVGVALAALNLRIARARLRGENADADFACWQRAIDCLRPIGEGLALFAEHDLFPGESEVTSEVMALLFPLFCAGAVKKAPDRAEQERLKKDALMQARDLAATLDAKCDLLESPLTGSYLAGYRAIKRLHHAAREACDKLRDADFFYAFALLWIFESADLAEALISGGDFPRLVEKRIDEMVAKKLAARVDEAERFLSAQPAGRPVGDIGEAPLEWPRFCGWTRERLDGFGKIIGELAGESLLRDMWDHRSIFRLGHFDADIAVEDGQCVARIGEARVIGAKVIDKVAPGSAPGRVEAWVGRRALSCLVTIRRQQELVAAIDVYRGGINSEQALAFARRVPSSVESEVLQNAFGILSGEIAQTAPQGGGILTALNGNRSLLRTLAAVSLKNSIGEDKVKVLAKLLGRESDALLEQLEAINRWSQQNLALPLVDGLPKQAIARV